MRGDVTRHKPLSCPSCGYDHLDTSMELAGEDKGARGPGPGDLTVCDSCGVVLTFGDDMTLHITPESTIKNALTDEERLAIAQVQDRIRLRKEGPHG